ncbi:hypothetical protein N8Z10_00560 [bacterium]|nr:hypothetical protein [bacterium]
MLTIKERIERIESTSHIVRIESSKTYVVTGSCVYGPEVFVIASGGFLFHDFDVFTPEEADDVSKLINKIKKLLIIK